MSATTYLMSLVVVMFLGSSTLAQDSTMIELTVLAQPIELSQFRVHFNENKVEVSWTTLSELNNQRFILERSTDGKEFAEVMEIPGAGTSCESINYFEVDWNPMPSLSYYRLKQIDFNGEFTYSGIVPVEVVAANEVPSKLFPLEEMETSENGTINLEELKDREAIVILRNDKGVEYYSKIKINPENEQLCAFSLDPEVPKGKYLITASSINEIYSKKLVIL